MLATLLGSMVLAKPPYDKYAGTTIVMMWPNHFQYQVAKQLVPDFEKETGIKVELDMLEMYRVREVGALELSKPVGDYDGVVYSWWKTEFVKKDLLQELAPLLANLSLVDPEYDFEDFVPGYLIALGIAGGRKSYLDGLGSAMYGVPFGSETSILAYRKDLFEKYGLTVPDTYDELVDIATFFYEEVDGMVGLTIRGESGHQCGHSYLNFAGPFGAKVFDENWEPAFQKEESLEVLRYMKKFTDTGPPGIPSFTYGAMVNAFTQGKAALYLDSTAIPGISRDPAQSKIVGKVGFAIHPRHKTRSGETGGWGFGIPKNSQNKEAAWLFIQWLTNKENAKRLCLLGAAPWRMSTVMDPELQKKFPDYKVLVEAFKYADPDWRPMVPEWPEVEIEYLGVEINHVLTGKKSPEEAMNSIVEPVREIMEKAGYYIWRK